MGCAANAVLTLPAQVAAVSALTTATETVIGDPVRPRAVTITVALPDPDIVPAAVAVSACAVPIICGVMKSPDPTRSTEYCGGSARFWLSVYLSTTIPSPRESAPPRIEIIVVLGNCRLTSASIITQLCLYAADPPCCALVTAPPRLRSRRRPA